MARDLTLPYVEKWAQWLLVREPDRAHRPWRWKLWRLGQLSLIVAREFLLVRGWTKAAALAFFTVLEAIPVIALAVFAISKLFGEELREKLALLLDTVLTQAGQQVAIGVFDKISGHAEMIGHGALGLFVLGVLVYGTLSLYGQMEGAWNEVWEVNEGRNYWRKFANLVFWLALGLLAIYLLSRLDDQLRAMGSLGRAAVRALALLRGLLLFFIAQRHLPNTQVGWRAGAWGALFSGGLWLLLRGALDNYVRLVFTHSPVAKVYGSLSLIPITLIFIYVSWVLLLLGGCLAFAIDNLDTLFARSFIIRRHEHDPMLRLCALAEVVRAHLAGEEAPTPAGIAARYHLPHAKGEEIAQDLHALKLVAVDTERATLHPAGDPAKTRVAAVLDALVRQALGERRGERRVGMGAAQDAAMVALYTRQFRALQGEFGEESLADLARDSGLARLATAK